MKLKNISVLICYLCTCLLGLTSTICQEKQQQIRKNRSPLYLPKTPDQKRPKERQKENNKIKPNNTDEVSHSF